MRPDRQNYAIPRPTPTIKTSQQEHHGNAKDSARRATSRAQQLDRREPEASGCAARPGPRGGFGERAGRDEGAECAAVAGSHLTRDDARRG